MSAAPRLASGRGAPKLAEPSFAQSVLKGLAAKPKRLSPKYFYDEQGSRLFERITQLPEYYPTRAEMRILTEHGGMLCGLLPARASIVEFGSGASRKFRALLAAKPDIAAYIPVDISAEFLEEETRTLRVDFPFLSVLPVATDFTRPFDLPRQAYWGPRVGFFPGSTIGNFEPGEAAAFLTHARMVLGPRSLMIVGVDLIKDKARLEAAYDDAAGVTAAFNLNLLSRINRELDATFEPAGFRHVAFYDEAAQRIEMHLESVRSQLVHVGAVPFTFAEGDRIHTENSYKYSVEGFQALAGQAGWAPVAVLSDPDRLFSMHVLKAQA